MLHSIGCNISAMKIHLQISLVLLFCGVLFCQEESPSEPIQVDINQLQVLQRQIPIYPAIARQAHIQGEIVLRFAVGTDGNVGSVHVLSGNGMLANAALEAIRQWKFKPYEIEGHIVSVTSIMNIRFTMADPTPPDPSELAFGKFVQSRSNCFNFFQHREYLQAEKPCQAMVVDAGLLHHVFGPNRIDLIHLYTDYAHVLMLYGKVKSADRYFALAVRFYELAKKKNPTEAISYKLEYKKTLIEYAWVRHLQFDNNGYHALKSKADAL